MNPVISVVIPAYNAEPYLTSCIDSILSQSFTEFEILIINDASNDRTPDIIDQYGRSDSRVVPVHQKNNGGPGKSRNVGIDLSKGEFIYTVDADDLVAPGAFKKLVSVAREDGVDVVCASGMGWRNSKPFRIKKLENKSEYRAIVFDEYPNLSYGCTWRFFYKRDLLEKNKIRFQEGLAMGDDIVFNARALPKAEKISIIKDVVYYYRQDGNGMCASDYDLQMYRDCILDAPRYGYLALDDHPVQQQWFIHRHLLRRLCYRLPQALRILPEKEANQILEDVIALGKRMDVDFLKKKDHQRFLAKEIFAYPLPLSLHHDLQNRNISFASKKIIAGIMPAGKFTLCYMLLGAFLLSMVLLPFTGLWFLSGSLFVAYLLSLWHRSMNLAEFLDLFKLFPVAFARFSLGISKLFSLSSLLRLTSTG